ncbi:MAG: hypothetical protein R8K49_00090 [Mariprofundaceae bacterium]
MNIKRTVVAKMIKTYAYMLVLLSVLVSPVVCLAQSHKAVAPPVKDDCGESSINFDDDPNLTRQEKISRMDRALMNSLNRYERCQDSRSAAAASNSGNGEAGIAGIPSSASTEMSGTGSSVESNNQAGEGVDETEQNKKSKGKRVLGSGKVPDDIPPADNDSVLEEQIRQAAMNENDPVIKAKLWNEYRKYKGLPIVGEH